ncbi:MAG: hypothetical protein HYY98_17145 [Burkholderiales bacterium]|nr:hypothetical protein [Burkholderiales bacterium]
MQQTDALIHLRVPAATKARWVRESRAAGMRLTDWIVTRIDGQKGEKTMIQYTIRPSVLTVDTRAAADACNRELASAGDTFDRSAVEKKLAECAPSLREWLTIDAEEIEVEE